MSKTFLKIKIVSLAAEARLIRREELRFPRGRRDHQVFQGLHAHRTGVVRDEARAALLAYGYLRGRPYLVMEAKAYEAPSWGRVAALASKYGLAKVSAEMLIEWSKAVEVLKAAA